MRCSRFVDAGARAIARSPLSQHRSGRTHALNKLLTRSRSSSFAGRASAVAKGRSVHRRRPGVDKTYSQVRRSRAGHHDEQVPRGDQEGAAGQGRQGRHGAARRSAQCWWGVASGRIWTKRKRANPNPNPHALTRSADALLSGRVSPLRSSWCMPCALRPSSWLLARRL